MDNLKQYWNSWWYENDGRKYEDYPIKRNRYQPTKLPERYRVQKPKTSLRSVRVQPERKREREREREREPEVKEYRIPKTNVNVRSTWEKVKSLFETDKRDLKQMKQAYVDYKLPSTEANATQEAINNVIANERFKKKLLERRYEKHMLDELRRGRRMHKRGRSSGRGVADDVPLYERTINHVDEVILLRKKIDELEQRLSDTIEELVITKKKLEFSQEKNALLEELFDDGNMETEYVKSRRHMANLQNSSRKPELKQLPRSPSPVLHVNPMFTSSPIRATTTTATEGQQDNFYEKYPRIPETENLANYRSPTPANGNDHNDTSLSPVRVDYSKYSNGL